MSAPRLARALDCRYCGQPIYLALCADGRRRAFDQADRPRADRGVWAWRRGQGMQETDLVAGKSLHFCAQFHAVDRNALGAP